MDNSNSAEVILNDTLSNCAVELKNKNKVFYIGLGGFLNYLSYYLVFKYTNNVFLSSMVCAIVTSIYSNIMAVILKCPSTIFILTGLIPVVPGSSLFYMMNGLVMNDYIIAKMHLLIVVKVIIGIVAGMSLSTVIVTFIREFVKHFKVINKKC